MTGASETKTAVPETKTATSGAASGPKTAIAEIQPRCFETPGHNDTPALRWLVELNVWSIKRVRLATGVEIGKWSAGGKDAVMRMLELFHDVEKFVDVLYVLCEDQCKDRGISDEQFGRGMRGDSIEQAADAFYGAFADFCRSEGRGLLLDILQKMKDLGDRATTLARNQVRSINLDAALEKAIQEAATSMDGPSTISSGNTPASSASTPPDQGTG